MAGMCKERSSCESLIKVVTIWAALILVLTTSLSASDITSTLARCPSTKLVVSGYSQGGQLVHNAAALVGATGMAGVSSVVIFGDPLNGYPVTGATTKTDVICAFGDDICLGGDLVLVQHLTYSLDADEAADYVAQKAGL